MASRLRLVGLSSTLLASSCGGCHDTCDVVVTSSLDCVRATPTVSMGYKPGCDADPRVNVTNECTDPMMLDGREAAPGESIQVGLEDHTGTVGSDALVIGFELECE